MSTSEQLSDARRREIEKIQQRRERKVERLEREKIVVMERTQERLEKKRLEIRLHNIYAREIDYDDYYDMISVGSIS